MFVAGTSYYEEFVTDHAQPKPSSCEDELADCKVHLQESSASLREAKGRISGSFFVKVDFNPKNCNIPSSGKTTRADGN